MRESTMTGMKTFIVVLALVALAACRQEGPAEKAGRQLDQAGKDLRDAVKGKK
jgi:predicted small lipoprotein YifL